MYRFLRYFVFVFPVIFIVAIYALANSQTNDPILVAALVVSGLGSVFQFSFTIWDRYLLDPRFASAPRQPASEKMYLEGRLRAFEREEKLFVELAGDTFIESRFDSYEKYLHLESSGRIFLPELDLSNVTVIHGKIGKGSTASLLKFVVRASKPEYPDIAQIVEKFEQFVIVGEPGSGKSTVLRHIATDLARKYIVSNGEGLPLPLWINLGLSENPIQANDLLHYWWHEQYFLEGDPETYLNNNKLWLFLDGLNEMPEQRSNRKERVAALLKLLKAHPEVPAIVTCRIQDYEELKLGDLPVVRVLPLDEEHIQEFIQKRLGEVSLWEAIKVKDALHRMASNPYNLVMLIELYERRHQLPADLYHLYGMFVHERQKEYFAQKKIQLPWETLNRRLGRLAARMILDSKGTAADVMWAQRQIGRQALKDGIDLGVLVQDEDVLRFFHQSLHGYFALPTLTKVLTRNWVEGIWRKRRANLIVQIGALGEAATPAVPALLLALNDENLDVRSSAVVALGRIGSLEAVPTLIKVLRNEKEYILQFFSAWALGQIGSPEAVPALIEALKDDSIQYIAAEALGEIGNPKSVPALLAILKDGDTLVRALAAQALGKIGNPESVPALSIALADEDIRVQSSAAGALAQIGNDAVPALLAALKDEHDTVRGVASWAIAEISSPEVVLGLLALLKDERKYVRESAAEILEEINTPEAQEALKKFRGQ